ncbi:hypothetical protein TrVGV298_000468 [Trichoderma virens]|nr:hypothetical protein TrVGV298_000468 [Trichoderma virens]
MPFNDFCEDDESILCSSACLPSVEHLAPKELYGYSSSVYSSDTSSTDNNKLATSPQLLGDADNTISPVSSSSSMEDPCILGPDTRKLASHPSQYERTEMEEEYLDLYDRDWAEYYFDESNFTPKKDPWESLYKYVLVLHNTAQNK